MRIILKLKILLFLSIICVSCSTYISYTITTPPEINIPDQQNKIGFINKYDYTSLSFNKENKNEVYVTAVQQLISSLENSFNSNEYFNIVLIDTLKKGTAQKDFPPQMNASEVVGVCDSANIDMLLVLEYFDTDFLIETETEEDDDGSTTRTNIVDLVVRTGWTLYDKSGNILDRQKSDKSMLYQSRPALVSFVVIGPSMGKAGKEVNTLANEIGESYIQNFYPGRLKESAKIYTGEAFEKVESYMNNDNWEEAIELLLPMANSTDSKISKKASHNLSIAYKASGNNSAYEYWKKK